MIWIALAAAVAVLAFAVRALVAFLKPRPETGTRRCPHCGHEFEGVRRYCIACGGQIWDDVLSQ